MPFDAFPDPRNAPADAPLAWGGDLSKERLLEAYRLGIFPWYSDGEPVLWWSPDPRFVLLLKEYHFNHGLKRELKKACWRVTFDQAFSEVIRACRRMKRKGQEGTWITEEMVEAYEALHEAGYAHSVECWRDGALVGGLYGISLGGVFFGESMFYEVANASKVAFATLLLRLEAWGFTLIDCQMETGHLASFGAKSIPRDVFFNVLEDALGEPNRLGIWDETS